MEEKELKIDPEFQSLFPRMTKEEFAELKEDIMNYKGLREPIEITPDNYIIDGYNRYLALKELKKLEWIRTSIKDFAGNRGAIIDYIHAKNAKRRSLNDFQKVEEALRYEELRKKYPPFGGKVAIEKMAKEKGVSKRTFERAKAIIEKGGEELKEKVRRGSISISRGCQKVRVPTKTKLRIPTKLLNQTKTNTVSCDFHLHHYVGCSHGCLYCYCEWMSFVKHKTWLNAFPVPNAIEILRRDIENLKEKKTNPKGIMVSSSTDPYQPLDDKYNLTRACLELLMKEAYRIVILTKNKRILKDIDLFKGYDNIICGVTITTLNDYVRRKLESGASKSDELIEVLKTLHDEGIKTYCSIEPVLVGVNPIETVEKVKDFVDVLEFGRRTPFEKGFDSYYGLVFKDIINYCKKHGITYGIAIHSKPFCEKYKIPFKTCVP